MAKKPSISECDSPLDGQTPPTLVRLAEALQCTVGNFYRDEAPADIEQLARLTASWLRLKDPAARERILRGIEEEIAKADGSG